MKRFMIAFSLAAAVILAGCGSSSSGPSAPPDYYPIAVGNWWVVSVDAYATAGTDTLTMTGTTTQSVSGTTTHAQGFDLWEIEEIDDFTFSVGDTTWNTLDTSYSYIAESDSEIVAYDDTITLDHEIIMKLPVTVGETWNPYTDEPDIVREILSVSASVSVPAGSFSGCLHFSDTDPQAPDDDFEAWAAPDVGPCMFHADSADIIFWDGELQSYAVN
jgi:hypothetical protein